MVCIVENLRVHGPARLGVRVVPLKILQLLLKLLDLRLRKGSDVDIVCASHKWGGFRVVDVDGAGAGYERPFAGSGTLGDEMAFLFAVGADLLSLGCAFGLSMSFFAAIVATCGANSVNVHGIWVSGGGSVELWRRG